MKALDNYIIFRMLFVGYEGSVDHVDELYETISKRKRVSKMLEIFHFILKLFVFSKNHHYRFKRSLSN